MSPDTEALKAWTTVLARACLMKVQAYRTDPADGVICYFSVVNGITTRHADLQA